MSTSANYQIELPVFTGPLELLLHLIDRDELDITAVSLTAVTEQYLLQVEALKEGRVEHLVDFLVIGAKLLVIKSRALLPQVPASLQDEEEEDPAEALARQLRTYKQFKDVANWLDDRNNEGLRTYLRVAPLPRLENKLDLAGTNTDSLTEALRAVMERAETMEDSVSVAVERRTLTIEQQIQRLRTLVRDNERVQFNELLTRQITRVEISITLLAVLELIKRHEVNAHQPILFGPIEIVASSREA